MPNDTTNAGKIHSMLCIHRTLPEHEEWWCCCGMEKDECERLDALREGIND